MIGVEGATILMLTQITASLDMLLVELQQVK